MDFQNRIRKMRIPDQMQTQMQQYNQSNQQQMKSRKVYKLHSSNSHNLDSGGGEEHDSGGEDSLNQMPLKPHLQQQLQAQSMRKQPVHKQISSGIDSGMDSTGLGASMHKRPVTQTDSNTSTGSTNLHNANIKMELERRLAVAAKANENLQSNIQAAPRRREVPSELKNIVENTQSKSSSDYDIYNNDKYNKKKNKKKNPKQGSDINLSESQNNNYIKIKYPPLNTNTNPIKLAHVQESDSDDSYIEDVQNKKSTQQKQTIQTQIEGTKHHYASRDDFADDENDDAKSQGSSNQGHDAIDNPTPIITNHDKSPIVESTAIVSKNPVKLQLSNKTSLGLNVTGDHNLNNNQTVEKQYITPDSGHSDKSCSEKDCSCTCTSASGSEFQSSHHDCCSSQTNSIKNIGNNNNNKKIIEANINKNSIREDHDENQLTVEGTNKKSLNEERSLVPAGSNRNKQYVNNTSTKVMATFHNNGTQRAQITNPHQTKPSDYAYASKFANTMAKVPSAIKPQPTSKRVNGVTLRDLYSLRAVLSDSDNGTVFSGRRRIDNAAVAIKRIMKSKVKRWHMIKEKSVPMEIALLRKVNETRHAGVVTLLEWFECSDCFLLVMARPTPVLDLFDYVSEKKRLDENTCKMIFVQVVEAMVHCHQRSVLHRDIKLENILVKTDTLISTIIDFGCGTHLHSNLYKDFAGTPQYYPPEYYICKQYHGLPAAVWSVGVMLYAMLCGRLPFASAHEIVHLEPSWHGSFCRKISPAAKDLVEHMLKKQPRRRLQMQEILKHRWLKNTKYDPASGNVTVLSDDNNVILSNASQHYEKEPVSAKSSTNSMFN